MLDELDGAAVAAHGQRHAAAPQHADRTVGAYRRVADDDARERVGRVQPAVVGPEADDLHTRGDAGLDLQPRPAQHTVAARHPQRHGVTVRVRAAERELHRLARPRRRVRVVAQRRAVLAARRAGRAQEARDAVMESGQLLRRVQVTPGRVEDHVAARALGERSATGGLRAGRRPGPGHRAARGRQRAGHPVGAERQDPALDALHIHVAAVGRGDDLGRLGHHVGRDRAARRRACRRTSRRRRTTSGPPPAAAR